MFYYVDYVVHILHIVHILVLHASTTRPLCIHRDTLSAHGHCGDPLQVYLDPLAGSLQRLTAVQPRFNRGSTG